MFCRTHDIVITRESKLFKIKRFSVKYSINIWNKSFVCVHASLLLLLLLLVVCIWYCIQSTQNIVKFTCVCLRFVVVARRFARCPPSNVLLSTCVYYTPVFISHFTFLLICVSCGDVCAKYEWKVNFLYFLYKLKNRFFFWFFSFLFSKLSVICCCCCCDFNNYVIIKIMVVVVVGGGSKNFD